MDRRGRQSSRGAGAHPGGASRCRSGRSCRCCWCRVLPRGADPQLPAPGVLHPLRVRWRTRCSSATGCWSTRSSTTSVTRTAARSSCSAGPTAWAPAGHRDRHAGVLHQARPHDRRPGRRQPARREGLHQAGDRPTRRPGRVLRRRGPAHGQRTGAGRAVHLRQLAAGRRRSGDECRSRQFDEVLVQPGQLFVMGDHRGVSQDSRCQGPVPIENVIGRAFVVVWPSSRWASLSVPPTFEGVPTALAPPLAPQVAPPAGPPGPVPETGGIAVAMPIFASALFLARSRRRPSVRQRRLRP